MDLKKFEKETEIIDQLLTKKIRVQHDCRFYEDCLKKYANRNQFPYPNKMKEAKENLKQIKSKLVSTLRFYEYALKFFDLTEINELTITRDELRELIEIMRGKGVTFNSVN
jgi:hypothetical protein